jgi:hypothetical protein
MKKLLLTGAMLCATYFSANAQTQIVTSFEESETAVYTAGDDLGSYSTWTVYSTATADDAVESGLISISDSWASEGSQSLKFAAVGNQDGEGNYADSPLYNFTPLAASTFDISFDTKTNAIDDNGSNFYYSLLSYNTTTSTVASVAGVWFNYDGSVLVWDSSQEDQTAANDYGYVYVGDFDADTALTATVRFNDDGTLSYLIDGEEVYNFTPADAEALTGYYYFDFGADDYDTDWYVDNITVALPTAGVTSPSLAQFAVYPNPASNVVNVSNADALVNNVALTDLNGRIVKTVKFNGVSDAQVNITDLASGVYLMTISSDKGTTTKKVVKE